MSVFTRKDADGNEVTLVEEDSIVYPKGYVTKMQCGGFREQMEGVRDMTIRDDDVMIAAYQKSGMHWLWEIVSMVANQRADYEKKAKETTMLDFRSTEQVEKVPSPRILNMHFPVRCLPTKLLEKRRPILHIMRNPKDLFVSFYYHLNALPGYQRIQSFSTHLSMMIGEHGFYINYPWSQYELEWEEFTRKNPDYPILNLYYEDIKKDPKKWIAKVASFLDCDISEELIHEIAVKTDIKAMQSAAMDKEGGSKFKVGGVPLMCRKGIIGDWKTHFTVAESEKMDKWLEENLGNTDLKFKYS